MVSKTIVAQVTVGSNPTPSATEHAGQGQGQSDPGPPRAAGDRAGWAAHDDNARLDELEQRQGQRLRTPGGARRSVASMCSGLLVTRQCRGRPRRDARGAPDPVGGAGGTTRPTTARRRDPVAVPQRRVRGRGWRAAMTAASTAPASGDACSGTCFSQDVRAYREQQPRPAPASRRCSRSGVDPTDCLGPRHARRRACARCSPASTPKVLPSELRAAAPSTRRCSPSSPSTSIPAANAASSTPSSGTVPAFSSPIDIEIGETVSRDGFVLPRRPPRVPPCPSRSRTAS